MAKRQQPTPLFTFCTQKHEGDCSISALAMALGLSYEAVLVVASRIIPDILVRGVMLDEIQVIARQFNREYAIKEKVDLAKDTGIVVVRYKKKTDEHVVFLTRGLIFEPTGAGDVWDAAQYVKRYKCKVPHALVEEG
jgi:hypothetical protein